MAGVSPPPLAYLADTHTRLNDSATRLSEHSREDLTGLDQPVQRGIAFACDGNTILCCANDATTPWRLARGLIH